MEVLVKEAGSLTPSGRLIVYYMAFEALFNNRTWLTFNDIATGTGLSERTLRAALRLLRDMGLVEAVIDPARGRKVLYRLRLESILPMEEGIYLVDVGFGFDKLPPDAVRAIMTADVILYTDNVDIRLFDLARCGCRIEKLENASKQVSGRIVVLYNSLADFELVKDLIVDPRTKYICASNTLDKLLGSIVTYGKEKRVGNFRIKVVGSDTDPSEIAGAIRNGEIYGNIVVSLCGGRKVQVLIIKEG